MITYFLITSYKNWLRTCDWSLGGPGLNFDEQRGGSSTLGTKEEEKDQIMILKTGKKYNILESYEGSTTCYSKEYTFPIEKINECYHV